jgi:hypothetical protein
MLPNQDPPAGWPKPHRSAGRVLSVVGFTLLAVITAAVVVADATTGDAGQAVIFSVAVLMFAHLAAMAVSTLRRPTPSTRPPAAGRTDQGEQAWPSGTPDGRTTGSRQCSCWSSSAPQHSPWYSPDRTRPPAG